jgi:hypothetical protein
MLQPFWALPVVAIAGIFPGELPLRDRGQRERRHDN